MDGYICLKGEWAFLSQTYFLYIDESGNLGSAGRYFTIAAIETQHPKPLHNVMKKTILKVKRNFPRYEQMQEIKASQSNPIVKDYFLHKIASKKELRIRYIVADKKHVKKELLADENLLYNYLLKYLIVPFVHRKRPTRLIILLDKRSTKVKSAKSFEDYIQLVLRYELNLNISIAVSYLESQHCYLIQAADFVSNAIYAKYEHQYDYYVNIISSKIVFSQHFPYHSFSK